MSSWRLTPRRIRFATLIVFVVLTSIGMLLVNLIERQRWVDRQVNLRQVASNQTFTIQRQLDQSLSSTYALASILRQNEGQIENFDALAAEMIRIYAGISSLQLAPDGIVTQIYPLAGNEPALGFNVLRDLNRRGRALAAIYSRQLTLTGPFEVVQGGMSMIGRYPVFLGDDPGQEIFWGFTQTLIKVPEFVEAANLHQLEANGFTYQLFTKDLSTDNILEIAASNPLPGSSALLTNFEVPNGVWTLALDYRTPPPLGVTFGLEMGVVLLASALVTGLTNRFFHQALLLYHTNTILENEVKTRQQAQQEIHAAKDIVEVINSQLQLQIDQLADSQEALRQSETRYKTLLDAIPDLILRIDAEGRVIDLKPDGSSLSHKLAAEIGRPALNALPPKVIQALTPAVINARASQKIQTFEFTIAPDSAPSETFEARIGIQENNQIVCVIRNITPEKRMQTELLASQKLASLGSLAAGVAHEMNSPLQVITGLSNSLVNQLKEQAVDLTTLNRYLDMINRNGWRAAEIVRALLQYAHSSSEEMRPIPLNEIVKETLLLIENQLKTWDNVQVEIDLETDLPDLYCNESQISQAIINLLSNARDAMPAGGIITLRTRYDAQEGYVLLQITDTGEGISNELQDRIFDPFFTTKEVGRGTGLGLSIVLGIVNSHGGEIRVSSPPGAGATFTLAFPTASNL